MSPGDLRIAALRFADHVVPLAPSDLNAKQLRCTTAPPSLGLELESKCLESIYNKGEMKEEILRRAGALLGVMRVLYQTVVVKMELSMKELYSSPRPNLLFRVCQIGAHCSVNFTWQLCRV